MPNILSEAKNFLKFCSIGSGDGMALAVGVSDVACGAGVGRMWTSSGLFLGWTVELESKFMGIG